MQLYKNEDIFTDLGLSEKSKMPKKKQIFKDTICVGKGDDEDIYVFSHICIDYPWEYTQETANTGCFQAEEMNDGTTGGSFL